MMNWHMPRGGLCEYKEQLPKQAAVFCLLKNPPYILKFHVRGRHVVSRTDMLLILG